jgi:hypothetical protein
LLLPASVAWQLVSRKACDVDSFSAEIDRARRAEGLPRQIICASLNDWVRPRNGTRARGQVGFVQSGFGHMTTNGLLNHDAESISRISAVSSSTVLIDLRQFALAA